MASFGPVFPRDYNGYVIIRACLFDIKNNAPVILKIILTRLSLFAVSRQELKTECVGSNNLEITKGENSIVNRVGMSN